MRMYLRYEYSGSEFHHQMRFSAANEIKIVINFHENERKWCLYDEIYEK